MHVTLEQARALDALAKTGTFVKAAALTTQSGGAPCRPSSQGPIRSSSARSSSARVTAKANSRSAVAPIDRTRQRPI